MEELQDMKAMWSELNNRVTILEEENRRLARKVIRKNYQSYTSSLERRYKRFIFLGLIMALFVPLMIFENPECVDKYKPVTMIYWGVFFLLEASVDFYLMMRVKDIDVNNYSVSQVAKSAARIWKIHKLAIICGIPGAIGAIILFALVMNANEFVIYGMFCGFIIGLVIGIRQLLKFRNDYKLLQGGVWEDDD